MSVMLARVRAFRAGAGALALTLATPANAQPPSVPPPTGAAPSSEASAHFERGVTFYGEGDYVAALVEFKRAYEIAPAWRVLFNIGQSYFQVRDYARALTTLRQFVSEGQDRIGEKQRAIVDGELADLSNRVGSAVVECNLAGAAVMIDDRAVGVTPLPGPVTVSVGVRTVTAVYPGRAPVVQELSVTAGDTVAVRVDFPVQAAAATPTPPPPERPRPLSDSRAATSSSPRNLTLPILSFSVAALGAGVGATFGILALDDKSRLDSVCTPNKACPTTSQPNINALSRDTTLSTIGFGVAVAGAALGITSWLLAGGRRPGDASHGSSRPGVSLQVGAGLVAGTF